VALEARAVDETAAGGVSSAAELRVSALAAFNARDFPRAVLFLTRLAALEPAEYRWREALAQCFVDGGGFAFGGAEQSSKRAAAEYTEAIKLLEGAFLAKKARDDDRDANTRTREHLLQIMSDVSSSDVTPSDATIDEDEADFFVTAARLLAGRALAYELAGAWSAAVAEYDKAVATAARGGAPADPLILNQRANALAQSGDWAAARLAYLQSAQGFRDAGGKPSVASRAGAGINNARGSSPSFAKFRADGVAFASANAALALAELGDLRGAELELRAVSRRAPGLVDARAALAALYWASGRPDDAEREWEFACDNVDVGCAKYRDNRWVAETRRWPPAMAELLRRFLSVS
jgi:tetratricopeptide (TPR) repeat protein